MENIHQQKIQKYEEFVDKRLKPDLLHATAQRYSVYFVHFILGIQIMRIDVCHKFQCYSSIISRFF
jgi:hypothetical protein